MDHRQGYKLRNPEICENVKEKVKLTELQATYKKVGRSKRLKLKRELCQL